MTAGSPVRVLLLVKGLGLGGAERLLVDQALAADPAEVSYTVAAIRPDKVHFVAALEAAGVPVVPLRPGGSRAWPWHLARTLRSQRPDIVHSHSPLPAAIARVLVAIGGRRTRHVYTEHNRWAAYRLPTRVLNAATMVLDAKVWAVSSEARSSIRPGGLRRRAEPLHHGVDLEGTVAAGRREPEPPVRPAPQGAFHLIHVANLRPEKAHDVVLAAFARAAADDADLHLWLVGQRLDEPAFAAAVDAHPARERIQVLGYRSDAPALIARADALVLGSDHEGLPVAVMEAFALGTPVVSTDVGGIPEAVTHEVEGLLVGPRDPEALAAALVRLHREDGLRDRLAAGARARASAFDARHARRAQEETYRRLARRS